MRIYDALKWRVIKLQRSIYGIMLNMVYRIIYYNPNPFRTKVTMSNKVRDTYGDLIKDKKKICQLN